MPSCYRRRSFSCLGKARTLSCTCEVGSALAQEHLLSTAERRQLLGSITGPFLLVVYQMSLSLSPSLSLSLSLSLFLSLSPSLSVLRCVTSCFFGSGRLARQELQRDAALGPAAGGLLRPAVPVLPRAAAAHRGRGARPGESERGALVSWEAFFGAKRRDKYVYNIYIYIYLLMIYIYIYMFQAVDPSPLPPPQPPPPLWGWGGWVGWWGGWVGWRGGGVVGWLGGWANHPPPVRG